MPAEDEFIAHVRGEIEGLDRGIAQAKAEGDLARVAHLAQHRDERQARLDRAQQDRGDSLEELKRDVAETLRELEPDAKGIGSMVE